MKPLNIITLVLIIIGGLNWGLMGLFQIDLVAMVFGGSTSAASRLLYVLIGLSALYQFVPLSRTITYDEVYAQRT